MLFLQLQAVGSLRLRQAPVRRPASRPPLPPDPDATARMAAALTGIIDDDLRNALARLGAAIKQG